MTINKIIITVQKKSNRPHTKADHKKEKKKYMYKYNVSYKNFK